jgi:hypothetical protein
VVGRERTKRKKAHSSRWWCGALRVCFACRFELPRAGREGKGRQGKEDQEHCPWPLHLQQHAGRRQWRRLVFRPYLRYVLYYYTARTSTATAPFPCEGKKKKEERLWILAFIARSDAPPSVRVTPSHASPPLRSARRPRSIRGRKEGDPIPTKPGAESSPTGPAAPAAARFGFAQAQQLCVRLPVVWTPPHMARAEESRTPQVRCGGARQ